MGEQQSQKKEYNKKQEKAIRSKTTTKRTKHFQKSDMQLWGITSYNKYNTYNNVTNILRYNKSDIERKINDNYKNNCQKQRIKYWK